MLERLEIGAVGKRTTIGDAIGISLKRLEDVESKSNIVILLTDGRSNSGRLTPEEAAEIAFAKGVKIYAVAKTKVEFTGRDILPLKKSLDALESEKTIPMPMFILYLLIPSLLYFALLGFFRLTRKKDDPAETMARRAEKALKEAKNCRDAPEDRLVLLYRALVFSILAKGGFKGESLTYAEAKEILAKKSVDSDIASETTSLLMRIESVRYGGATKEPKAIDELWRDISKTVSNLARQ